MTYVAVLLVILLGFSVALNVIVVRKALSLDDFVNDMRADLESTQQRLSSNRDEIEGLLRYDVFQDDYVIRTAVKCMRDAMLAIQEAATTVRNYSDESDTTQQT